MTVDKPVVKKAAIGLSTINPADLPQIDLTVAREISGIVTNGFGGGAEILVRAMGECAESCFSVTAELAGSDSIAGFQGRMGDFIRARARSQMSCAVEMMRLADATLSELLTSSGRLVKAAV